MMDGEWLLMEKDSTTRMKVERARLVAGSQAGGPVGVELASGQHNFRAGKIERTARQN